MKKTNEKKVEKNKNLQILKKELCEMIDKRAEDKIIEKENSDLIKKLINNASDEKEATMIATLGTLYKKTGFTFAPCLEKNDGKIKYFKKNEKLSFKQDDGKPIHKLIIGDNFDALNNLLIEYRNRIDVIYIDPPYGKDSMGEFAKTNYNNNITRDNLLSMLYPRLILAKQLLSDDGVIFCSIDDKNQAYVKCIFDEVFGERNHIATLHWQKKKQPSYLSKVASIIEYVLVYAINAKIIKKLSIECITDSDKPVINSSNPVSERLIKKGIRVKTNCEKIKKGSYINKTMKIEILNDISIKNGRTLNEFKCKAKFRATQDNINDYCMQDLLFITKNIGLRRDLTNEEIGKAKAITDLLLDWEQNQDGSDELKSIFNIKNDENMFDNPKPVLLVKNLIKSTMKEDIIFLDFYAGSCTSGQSLLELDFESEMGVKQFIVVQLNEDLDNCLKNIKNAKDTKQKETIKNQIDLCDKLKRPHELSEISAERLRRVMTGKSLNGKKDFQWIKNNEPLGGSLDVYNIESISSSEFEKGKTAFDVIDETLYGEDKIKKQSEKIAWVCENFAITQKTLKED